MNAGLISDGPDFAQTLHLQQQEPVNSMAMSCQFSSIVGLEMSAEVPQTFSCACILKQHVRSSVEMCSVPLTRWRFNFDL